MCVISIPNAIEIYTYLKGKCHLPIKSGNGSLLFYDTHFVTTALLRPSICMLLQVGNSRRSSEATGVPLGLAPGGADGSALSLVTAMSSTLSSPLSPGAL